MHIAQQARARPGGQPAAQGRAADLVRAGPQAAPRRALAQELPQGGQHADGFRRGMTRCNWAWFLAARDHGRDHGQNPAVQHHLRCRQAQRWDRGAPADSQSNSTQGSCGNCLNVNPNAVTVAGISCGGFMAVQLQVAYSTIIFGTAIFAGGPYYCAHDTLTDALGQCESGNGISVHASVLYTNMQNVTRTSEPSNHTRKQSLTSLIGSEVRKAADFSTSCEEHAQGVTNFRTGTLADRALASSSRTNCCRAQWPRTSRGSWCAARSASSGTGPRLLEMTERGACRRFVGRGHRSPL